MAASRTADTVVLVVFVAFLALPALVAALGIGRESGVAAQEQRQRAAWPAWPRDLAGLRTLPGALQHWFDDRFGLRDQLILVHNGAKAMAGVSPNDQVVIGRDGWLFIEQSRLGDANRGALPFAEGEVDRLLEHFLDFQARLDEAGIAYVHFTPPDKQSLYADLLPARLKVVGPSRYDTWRAAALGSALNFVDVYPALAAARDAGERPYLQTDSHWNCRGAYLAYREVMAVVQQRFAGPLRVLTPEEVVFRPLRMTPGRDLARNVIGIPALFPEGNGVSCTIADAAPLTYFVLETGAPLTARGQEIAARASRTVNGRFAGGPRALVVRDSYANAMLDFLNQSFGEVIYLHRAEGLPDEAFIEEWEPDLVLYEHVERSLVSYSRRLSREESDAGS